MSWDNTCAHGYHAESCTDCKNERITELETEAEENRITIESLREDIKGLDKIIDEWGMRNSKLRKKES